MACPLPRITVGTSAGIEDVTRIMVVAETLMHRDRVWQNLLNYRAHMHLSLSNDL